MKFWLLLSVVFSICVSNGANAAGLLDVVTANKPADSKFLPAALAFQVSSKPLSDNEVQFTWIIALGYYLYQAQTQFTASNGARVRAVRWLSTPQSKDDPNFGTVAVFHGQAVARVILDTHSVSGGHTELRARYQGCADGGLCYPPMNTAVALVVKPHEAISPNQTIDPSIDKSANRTMTDANKSRADGDKNLAATGSITVGNAGASSAQVHPPTDVVLNTPANVVATIEIAPPANRNSLNDADHLTRRLTEASLPMLVGLMLLFGVGLAFTPCVFPMVPIVSSIIAGHNARHLTPLRGFTLALTYVLGMALVYALLGSLMGALGARANVSMWLQQPLFIIATALLFVVLALSMFGWFTLQLPAVLRQPLDALSRRAEGGQVGGTLLMGALSALVVSPCVSAPLVGVLGFIGATGKAGVGALALFALAVGMGIPLLVIGAFGGALLPKAGAWMNVVKAAFGVGLLAVAVALLGRILPSWATMLLWAVLCLGAAWWLWRAWRGNTAPRWSILAVVLSAVYGIVLLGGAWYGATDPLRPWHKEITASAVPFKTLTRIDELNRELADAQAQHRAVVVDLSADWCTSCKVMEQTTFHDPRVVAALAPYTALRLDISTVSAEHQAWLTQNQLYGPPVVLFVDADGRALGRVVGEADADAFLHKIPR